MRGAKGREMTQIGRGIALGLAGVLLWFMPLASVGVHVFQTGPEVGNNLTYIVPASSLAYAIFSCFALHKLRIVAASISTGISLLFLTYAGSTATWALYCLIVVSGISWIVAYTDVEQGQNAVQDVDLP